MSDTVHFYVPGMFRWGDVEGKYPGISITGKVCDLMCKHCKGKLLESMIPVHTPEELVSVGEDLIEKGMFGALLSGGCDVKGKVPFDGFGEAIRRISDRLFLSAHTGIVVDKNVMQSLAGAGVKQFLVDVVGDQRTLGEVYGITQKGAMGRTLEALFSTGVEVVPHLIVGIYGGEIRGEWEAVRMMEGFYPAKVCVVVLMPDVSGWGREPELLDVKRVIGYLLERLPEADVSLGCARPRGRYRFELERFVIQNGIRRIALFSDTALRTAEEMGLAVKFHPTCCSVGDKI